MKTLISELPQVPAANDDDYTPEWVSDVPDDWSHTILVSPEKPVLHSRFNEKGELLISNSGLHLKVKPDIQSSEDQIDAEIRSTIQDHKSKAA